MEQLTEMVDFEVSFNQLEEFHVDVRKWEKLDRLSLIYNELKRYNQTALWTHPHLGYLDRFFIGEGIPEGLVFFPQTNTAARVKPFVYCKDM